MGFKFKLINPRKDQIATWSPFRDAIIAENKRVRDGIKKDFEATVETWETEVKFRTRERGRNFKLIFAVTTDSEIYGYVTEGTRSHVIRPRSPTGSLRFQTGYTPKTRVGFIGSSAGGKSGSIAFAKFVNHPGTEGRKFEQAIAKKWQKDWRVRLQKTISRVAARFRRG